MTPPKLSLAVKIMSGRLRWSGKESSCYGQKHVMRWWGKVSLCCCRIRLQQYEGPSGVGMLRCTDGKEAKNGGRCVDSVGVGRMRSSAGIPSGLAVQVLHSQGY